MSSAISGRSGSGSARSAQGSAAASGPASGGVRLACLAILAQGDPAAEFMYSRAGDAWKVLEAHLAGRDWVAADRPTIADLSLCGYLFWPQQIEMDHGDFPAIAAWLGRLRALPGWASPEDLMPSGM